MLFRTSFLLTRWSEETTKILNKVILQKEKKNSLWTFIRGLGKPVFLLSPLFIRFRQEHVDETHVPETDPENVRTTRKIRTYSSTYSVLE